MDGFAGLLGLIWGVLCIILFFKVWKACNNIQRLVDKYAPQKANNRDISKSDKSTPETREDIEKWLNEKQEN